MPPMDWTAQEQDDTPVPSSPTKSTKRPTKEDWTQQTEEQKALLPEIPEIFNDEYEEPEEVIIESNKNDNTFTKYSWEIVDDPKADKDNEYPDQVLLQTCSQMKRTYQKVNANVARRRNWRKYGMSKNDGPGPSTETTALMPEDLPIILANRKHVSHNQQVTLNETEEQELLDMTRTIISQIKANKLTPDKVPVTWNVAQESVATDNGQISFMARLKGNRPGGDSALGGGDSSSRPTRPDRPGRPSRPADEDEGCTVRVTNLSENIVDGDIQDLFLGCGTIKRLYLARDKKSNRAKGFAYVTFARASEAEKAIRMLHKYAYDHLILNVELSKRDKEKS